MTVFQDIQLQVSNYTILETGSGGGFKYIETSIIHNGKRRRLTAFFKDKSEETKISPQLTLSLSGTLQDDGEAFGLLLNNTEISCIA